MGRARGTNVGIYRSRFEESVANQLTRDGVKFEYEKESWDYDAKVYQGLCANCGSHQVVTQRSYTPDFFLPNGIVVECKGKLDTRTRTLLIAVSECHPDKDLRLVFQRDNWLTNKHVRRYSDWAREHGFECAVGGIPREWYFE